MAIVTDIFNKIPPYGLVHDLLGRETVERLLRFVLSNEHRFEDSTITHKEGERVEASREWTSIVCTVEMLPRVVSTVRRRHLNFYLAAYNEHL
jgi:hypothetical protein